MCFVNFHYCSLPLSEALMSQLLCQVGVGSNASLNIPHPLVYKPIHHSRPLHMKRALVHVS
jgi:hypothetical protein